jgi:camelysin-like metallo-endopeptidase
VSPGTPADEDDTLETDMNATRTRTARKVIGSLGIVGAAAAVAGLGTFGTFTDSTAPLNASVNTGTLSITLNPANDTGTLSMTAAGFVPGDSLSRSVNLVNDGSAAFSSLSLTGAPSSTTNALLTDVTNGLKLSVQSCSVPWTKPTATTYACSGTTKTMVNNVPALGMNTLPTPASLTNGGVDHLVVTLALPSTAGNEFQGLSSSLALTFGGTQANGTAR